MASMVAHLYAGRIVLLSQHILMADGQSVALAQLQRCDNKPLSSQRNIRTS
jgi:hypothetical protein